ncbi:MAG TPA: nucleoside triphosphate pyrophosphohydrolase [Gammaproteobacteria bacterium]|nr:nucleoside triphosphate pyrophosphohydrolase [Gammaproteobacteria bacterium]
MHPVDRLLDIMAALRDPQRGCPWDLKQTFETIAPYTIEEAYEVADAIERRDYADLCDELGDLLLQVVYHGQLAREAGHFEFSDIVAALSEKMVRRHPHVFGEADKQIENIKQRWEESKALERSARQRAGILSGVALALPALKRAQKLQKRAAHAGFDWPEAAPVLAKLKEEIAELEQAVAKGDADETAAELGDLIFSCVNLARHLHVDAEESLRHANNKFERRFNAVEKKVLETGKKVQDCTLEELDSLWDQVKAEEK